jgi:hypothetical protein
MRVTSSAERQGENARGIGGVQPMRQERGARIAEQVDRDQASKQTSKQADENKCE